MTDDEKISRLLSDLAKERARIDELERRRTEPVAASSTSTTNTVGLRWFNVDTPNGDAGDRFTTPAVTYTVRDPTSGNVLGVNIPVTGNGQRIVNATLVTYASLAIGYMNGATPVLLWANERYNQTNCGA